MKILITIFLISVNISIAQVTEQWVQGYSGTGNGEDKALGIAMDSSGSVYVTGYVTDTSTGKNWRTIKYNSVGVQQWTATLNSGTGNDLANAIAVDAGSNVYVTGIYGNNYGTIKYNSSGSVQWIRVYNGPGNGDDGAKSIAVDVLGNVYVTGYSVGSGTGYDYATIKYNSAGVQQWVSRYSSLGNNYDEGSSIAIDVSGNVYVTGSSSQGGFVYDYATIKYSSSGTQQWVQRYNGPENSFDIAQSIAVDASGSVYITGQSTGSGTGFDYATIKYSSSGTQQWVQRYNGPGNFYDAASSLAIDASGNVYVTGSSEVSGAISDYATIKYNTFGAQRWVSRYNGPGNSFDDAKSITIDTSGNVYVTGKSAGSGTNYDFATIKYNSTGVQQWVQRYNGQESDNDEACSIAVDNQGNVCVTGGSLDVGIYYDYATIKYSQDLRATITGFIQGFYNAVSNTMISDTVKVYLRLTAPPFSTVDSSKSKLDSLGTAVFYFSNVNNGTNYYIILKHRNSIETWSSSGNSFSSDSMNYNFTTAANKAFGNNQVQVDTSPVRFGIYSGDPNQDGTVDVGDLISVYNNVINFVTGYVPSDMNGDDFTDVSDLIITYNNSINFVSVIRP